MLQACAAGGLSAGFLLGVAAPLLQQVIAEGARNPLYYVMLS